MQIVSRREAIQKAEEIVKYLDERLQESNGQLTDAEFDLEDKYYQAQKFWDEFSIECHSKNVSWTTQQSDNFGDWYFYGFISRIY